VLLDSLVWEINTGAPTLERISSGSIIGHKGQKGLQRCFRDAMGLGDVGFQLANGLEAAVGANRTFY
jgi:hypothetical protein